MEYDGRLHAVELSHLSIQDYSETFYFKCMYIYIYFFFFLFFHAEQLMRRTLRILPKIARARPFGKAAKCSSLE